MLGVQTKETSSFRPDIYCRRDFISSLFIKNKFPGAKLYCILHYFLHRYNFKLFHTLALKFDARFKTCVCLIDRWFAVKKVKC